MAKGKPTGVDIGKNIAKLTDKASGQGKSAGVKLEKVTNELFTPKSVRLAKPVKGKK